MTEIPSSSAQPSPPPPIDPTDHLPLSFLSSDTVSPAPTRSQSTADWLPVFAGYAWLAYGASSLLVISHLPSPLSSGESLIGPILRQVFELSDVPSSPVTAVSWSPVIPSVGELAAASGNCISVISPDSASSKGSFCWSQNALLVQSTKVEAIQWTDSGDGIVSAGFDVVLWKRKIRSWEIAWKFRTDPPQNLVSATWSIEELSATAAFPTKLQSNGPNNTGNPVLVYYGNGTSEFTKTELHHPQPVSMIQWRPLSGRHVRKNSAHIFRHVLLTCCLDGIVRLWTEVDNGKVRKLGKDSNDQRSLRRSFFVAAVIEINQPLNGTLGGDVFLTWAIEISGTYKTGKDMDQFFSMEGEGQERVGACEWLIGFGPGTLITFWAIHCLDDTSPMRFPRITPWKSHELQEPELELLHRASYANSKDRLLLNKVVFSRNCFSGPPNICSLIQLLPCNSFVWSVLYAQTYSNTEETSFNKSKIDSYISSSAGGVLSAGHTGQILQVAIHPHIYEIELAVSLDSNGLLLFWLISTVSNCNLNLQTQIPSWKLCGKLVDHDLPLKYTSLRWAPSVSSKDRVLLMGHAGGIDCFIVEISQTQEENIRCHYICTIPPTVHGPYEDGPTNIFAIPLPSTCNKTFQYNKFLLLGVWMQCFCALSWEVILHSNDSFDSCCECNFEDKISPLCCEWKFENAFDDKRYCIGVNTWSSEFPEPHCADDVTSFSVLCPVNLMPMQEGSGFCKDLCKDVPAYVMATGYSNGRVKLWRSKPSKHLTSQKAWELVGMFVAHKGPVSAICLTDCGQKIATLSTGNHLEGTGLLHIWDTVHLIGTGSFLLEDRLSFKTDIIALNWVNLGNGQLFLGVCLENELKVYAQKRSDIQMLLHCGKVLNLQNWGCIAVAQTFSVIHDFLWGPRAIPVIIHESYISLLSEQLFLVHYNQHAKCNTNFVQESNEGGKEKHICLSVFTDRNIDIHNLKEGSAKDISREHKSAPPMKIDEKYDWRSSNLFVSLAQHKHGSSGVLGTWSLVEIAEKVQGIIPVYHPMALLMNIYSGNWKRAHVSVRHLVEYLTCASERNNSVRYDNIIPQISLSTYFEGFLFKDSADKGFQWTADARLLDSSSWSLTYDTKVHAFEAMSSTCPMKSQHGDYVETLEKLFELAGLTNIEKLQILAIIDLLSEIQHSASAYNSLDEPGRRFWIAQRFQQLIFFRSNGRMPSVEELVADGRLICWAFHSDCQENLLCSCLPNEPSWKEMRSLGVGFWFTNVAQLRARMEKLARLQYLKKRDPKDCALLYIALNRLQVLAGLFKISKDEKDKSLVGFLSRNFQEDKNKAAALKNAYVLMGRHQLELAVAFFLLGGDIQSAVTVCAKNLKDEQLALVICRLVEGRGGPLECQLITKYILPSASERDDYWLASLLEWELGNYSKSFLSMLGPQASSLVDTSAISSNNVAFMDPHTGLYCLTLANSNSMKNAIGEQNAATLGRWATFMAATAFKRCGLPLAALECLSSSSSTIGGVDQGSVSDDDMSQLPWGILRPSASDSFPWLLGDVAFQLESQIKLDLALWYFSELVRENPRWLDTILRPLRAGAHSKDREIQLDEKLLKKFQEKLYAGLAKFEQKFSVISSCVIKMIVAWLWNIRLSFIGCEILHDYTSQNHLVDKSHTFSHFNLYPLQHKSLVNSIMDISFLLSRFITTCSITRFIPKSQHIGNDMSAEVESTRSEAQRHYFQSILLILWNLRASIRVLSGSSEDLTSPLLILDLFEYYIHFASAWILQDSKVLFLMVQPLLIACATGQTPYEVDMANVKTVLQHTEELLASNLLTNDVGAMHRVIKCVPHKDRGIMQAFSEEEKWHVLGVCLWQHMLRFVNHKLHSLSIKLEDSCILSVFCSKISFWGSRSNDFESYGNSFSELIESVSFILANVLKTTLVHISSYHVKLLASFLQLKVENRLHVPTLVWFRGSSLSRAKSLYQDVSVEIISNEDELPPFDILWDSCFDPKIISESFEQENVNWLRIFSHKFSKSWTDVFKDISEVHENEEACNHEFKAGSSPRDEAGSLPAKSLFRNGRTFLSSWQKDTTIVKEDSHFQHAKEIYKRDGELLEALCINPVNEWQAALASNRKGIIFFSWEDVVPFRCQSDYIWSDADWPLNGWAGAESTPVPTSVSPGVGLGSKKGAHLGLGGATIGMGSFARPRRDLTGGGAFGIPGYAGIGASGLGWEVQEDFEQFIDPPATVENITTRAFSSHPSMPLFLVGSSNTHVYLWEFGKDKAIATYGILPAANVPPPYALASISALQFDHCGHRFATAALDGTVCTWQLEVGGRSNIRPTESSLCFNGYASDVSYIASSGSVIAAAGSSSNNVNVVIWDTLAPPTTSRASSICHEGGARSISVFDNDIGSGSISPLIITGGKGGDVGLHDFRYIATGRAKRHKHFENGDASSDASPTANMQAGVSNKVGNQNLNGMLWYIPKAHLGSVTKISTIPHTSLFLTGSKDGDVKLWDAKQAKLVYHWPKLHERRIFLQSSSQGFGGVVRAGVTDIQVVSHGFLTCGGDGSVKSIQFKDYQCLI